MLVLIQLLSCKGGPPPTSKPIPVPSTVDSDSGSPTHTTMTTPPLGDTANTADTGPVCSTALWYGIPTVIPGSYTDPVCLLNQTLEEICDQHTGSTSCPTFVEFLSQIGWFDGTCACRDHLFGSGSGVSRCVGSDGQTYDLVSACGGSFTEPGISELAVFDIGGAWVGYQWHYWGDDYRPPCCGDLAYTPRVIVGQQVVFDCVFGKGFVQSWQPSDFRDTGGGYPDTGSAACTDDSGSDSGDTGS